jgi:hypothetical protein
LVTSDASNTLASRPDLNVFDRLVRLGSRHSTSKRGPSFDSRRLIAMVSLCIRCRDGLWWTELLSVACTTDIGRRARIACGWPADPSTRRFETRGRNDAAVDVAPGTRRHGGEVDQVRNGNRWRVTAVDQTTNRLAAERLTDRARVVFDDEYLREHVRLGYAVTVHSAQASRPTPLTPSSPTP